MTIFILANVSCHQKSFGFDIKVKSYLDIGFEIREMWFEVVAVLGIEMRVKIFYTHY